MPKKEVRKKVNTKENKYCRTNCNGAVYGLGFIGSLVYYLSTVNGFWDVILGILKSIVWPVFLVYNLMKFLGM